MATTIITAIDALKFALRDRSGSFMSDSEYEQFLLAHTYPETALTAQRLTIGY